MLFKWMLLAACFGDGQALTYEEAYAKAESENMPLVVLVCATWCAPCQVMRKELSVMQAEGELKDVVICVVDNDERPELASKLVKGDKFPQLAVFNRHPVTKAWSKAVAVGRQSRAIVCDLVRIVSAR